MKKCWSVFLIITLVFGLSACSKKTPAVELNRNITLINPTGPIIIPAIALAKGQISTTPPTEVRYWKSNDEVVAALANQTADFVVLPITTAANLYAQQKNLVLLGVHEWKIFYMLAADEAPFTGWQSLKGKSIYTPPGRGNTVDVLLRIAIANAGLKPDEDVKILYTAPQEIVALYQAGKVEYAALPEPFITAGLKAQGRIVVDFQTYWHELTNEPERLPVAGLFVTSSFLQSYPNITEAFTADFSKSVQWCTDNPDLAINLAEGDLNIPAPIIAAAMERIDFHYVPIQECQAEVQNYLRLMQQHYPEGIPTLPDEGFYPS